jgi:hypothetical protein
MRKLRFVLVAILVAAAVAVAVYAAAPKTYQVTGPVLSVTSDQIVVQKGNDRWELGRDAGIVIKGDLKVGAKVTIQYRMVATSVEVKAETTKAPKK